VSAAFLVGASLLLLACVALLLRPLLRRREDAKPARVTAAIATVLLAGGAGLYAVFSEYTWQDSRDVAETPAAQAAVLAKQLARKPDDLEGWLVLGGKYMELDQFPLAARAYQRADSLANGRNAAAIIGLAEALLANDIEEIRGRAGRLFERVLEIEPNNFKALFYGAVVALSREDMQLGKQRFETLLALNPPEHIRAIIEKQLQAIEVAQSQQASQPATAAASAAEVQVRVSVAPNLRYATTPQAALFVLARDPDQPGPPFAAKRLPLRFPMDVTLSASDAMLPQRRITAGQTLDVVARISLSGQPQSASGDPFGQVSYHVGKDGKLNLVIDRLAP
jgi:cytochrome c-type biogenesis protein CcmH